MTDEPSLEKTVNYREFAILQQDITDMKSLMSRMVDTMGRISVIEERQQNMAIATAMQWCCLAC